MHIIRVILSSKKYSLTLIFSISLIFRLFFLSLGYYQDHGQFIPTSWAQDGYFQIANNLINQNGFSHHTEPPFEPNSLRAPLYPSIIATLRVLLGNWWAVLIFQVIVGSLIPLVGYFLIEQISPNINVTFFTALAVSVEPFTAYMASIIMTETFFTLFFLLGIYLFLKSLKSGDSSFLFNASVILATATYIKPTTIYLPIVIALIFILHFRKTNIRKRVLEGTIFIAIFSALLVPWIYRNHIVFGKNQFVGQQESNLYGYLAPSVIALENNIPFQTAQDNLFAEEGIPSIDTVVTLDNADHYRERGISIVLSHPIGLTKVIIVSLSTFFTHDSYRNITDRYLTETDSSTNRPIIATLLKHPIKTIYEFNYSTPNAFLIFARLSWVLIFVLSIIGIISQIRKTGLKISLLTIILIILYFAATTLINGLGVNGRFRMPVNIFFLYFAVFFITEQIYSLRARLSPQQRL